MTEPELEEILWPVLKNF